MGIAPVGSTKIENVAVASLGETASRLGAAGSRQAAVVGSVWQRLSVAATVISPVSTETTRVALVPRFMVETAKAAAPPSGAWMMPSFVGVFGKVRMSAGGVCESVRSMVSTPTINGAAVTPPQLKSIGTARWLNGIVLF